jgi:hypothetical protein
VGNLVLHAVLRVAQSGQGQKIKKYYYSRKLQRYPDDCSAICERHAGLLRSETHFLGLSDTRAPWRGKGISRVYPQQKKCSREEQGAAQTRTAPADRHLQLVNVR